MSEHRPKSIGWKEALAELGLGPWPAMAAFLALFACLERTVGAHQSDVYESLVAWRAWTGTGPWPMAETGWNAPWNIWASIPFVAAFGPARSAIYARNAFFGRYFTSVTSSGRTQWTRLRVSGDPKRLSRGGGLSSGILGVASGCRRRHSRSSSAWPIPVPARPA